MAATYRLKGLGWFGGVVIVSLGFYLISLQVAAERKRLDQINAKIGLAQRDIRALETEFDVRANLAQLERWNGDTLALAAPTAGQFVRDEGQLASIRFDGPRPVTAEGAVRTAALVVPSLPTIAPPPPSVIDEGPAQTPTLVKAVAMKVATTRAAVPSAPAAESVRATPTIVTRIASTSVDMSRRARAVAMLDQSLLSDTTLGDLMSGARAEARRR